MIIPKLLPSCKLKPLKLELARTTITTAHLGLDLVNVPETPVTCSPTANFLATNVEDLLLDPALLLPVVLSTGDPRELSTPSRTKDNVDHAGLSAPLLPSREATLLSQADF
jgi:hypothetical protein